MPDALLEACFPNLAPTGFSVESPAADAYNCVAWAAGDNGRWWWPGDPRFTFWPAGVPREESLSAFVRVFEGLGFEACEVDGHEPGWEKIAIYVDAAGSPTHLARQLASGLWTSKLGQQEDILHAALQGLEGLYYGHVARVMKRPLTADSP